MTLRAYLVYMLGGTVLGWTAWILIILYTNPFSAGLGAIFLFYATLFLSLVGTFAVLGFGARALITKKNEVVFRKVKCTFRH